jgi:spermidine/putrescine transport system permease protein
MNVVRKTPLLVRFTAGFGFLLIYLPLLAMVLSSFLEPPPVPGDWGRWTLKWYQHLFHRSAVWDAFYLSVIVAFWTTLISTLLGTMAAIGLARSAGRLSRAVEGLAMVPIVMPEILLGLSLLLWFVCLRLSLGSFSIILAHVTFSVSYVFMSVRTKIHTLDPAFEEAALDLGASAFQTFIQVRLPLLWPGIFSGALMAFTLSFDDFLVTFFTSGIDSETLPIHIYAMIRYGVSPETNALSTLLLVLTFLGVSILTRSGDLETPHH